MHFKPDTLGVPGKAYLVGGAVRDLSLNRDPKDWDYVIVGGNQRAMLDAGFKQIGIDFPVFHHPVSMCEFSLARVERKSGVGYQGFAVETDGVTLEQDLSRRDFTINAMAYDFETDTIIDPFGGQDDLKTGTIKHVTTAFKDDPVRTLRAARFSARYRFKIHEDTIAAAKQVSITDLHALSTPRIMLEIEKAVPDFRQFVEALELMNLGFLLEAVLGFKFVKGARYPINQTNDKDALLVALLIVGNSVGIKNLKRKQFEGVESHRKAAWHWIHHLMRVSTGSTTGAESWVEMFDRSKGAKFTMIEKAIGLLQGKYNRDDCLKAYKIYSAIGAANVTAESSDVPLEGARLGKAIKNARIFALAMEGF